MRCTMQLQEIQIKILQRQRFQRQQSREFPVCLLKCLDKDNYKDTSHVHSEVRATSAT